ncbi:hypothetical protein BCD51_06205 [Neisseria meningitidis]|nr:hypothetical protein [Neisseria meningitidis]
MHIIQNPVIPTKQKIKNSNLKSRPSLKMHIIQNPVIPTKQKIKNSNLKSRPSLPCGNPTYLVSVLFLVSGDF